MPGSYWQQATSREQNGNLLCLSTSQVESRNTAPCRDRLQCQAALPQGLSFPLKPPRLKVKVHTMFLDNFFLFFRPGMVSSMVVRWMAGIAWGAAAAQAYNNGVGLKVGPPLPARPSPPCSACPACVWLRQPGHGLRAVPPMVQHQAVVHRAGRAPLPPAPALCIPRAYRVAWCGWRGIQPALGWNTW